MTATDKHREIARKLAINLNSYASRDDIAAIADALSTAHREGFEEGMKRAAEIAAHLNGWGSRDGTAEHIAKVILSEAERTA